MSNSILASRLRDEQLRKNLAYQTTYTTYSNPFHPLHETQADRANTIRMLIPSGKNIEYYEGQAYNYRKNNMELSRSAQMLNYDAYKPRKVIPGDVSFRTTFVPTDAKNTISTQNTYMVYGVAGLLGIVIFTMML